MSAEAEKCGYQYSWVGNSTSYAEQGCYEWMASQLDELKPSRVFDVGCGNGEGLIALRQRFGCQRLSIDENAYCLRHAARALRDRGGRVQTKERFRYADIEDGRHLIGVEPGEIILRREVMLVQGDLLPADDELFRFITSRPLFDAVTIWLIGAFEERKSCVNLDDFKMKRLGEYRLHIQNKTYELAARILRPGGLLQVVDRSEIPEDKSLHEELLQSHRDQASTTDLEVLSIAYRPYSELTGGRGIRVLPTPGSSGRMPSKFTWGMNSVLARKPVQ